MEKEHEYQFCESTFKFNEPLSEEEQSFVCDVFDIGQRIKDQKTLKDILCSVFKLTSVATGRFIDVAKDQSDKMINISWQSITERFEISKTEELKNKLAEMCLKYANMESTNNKAGAELLHDIKELTKALNAINNDRCHVYCDSSIGKMPISFISNPYLTDKLKEKLLKYNPLENGYYWVKVREYKKWEILKYHNGYFYVFNTGECKVRHQECDIYEIGERIEH